MPTKIGSMSRASINALLQDTREHGIFNTKFTAVNNSTTEQSMGVDLSSSSYDILCAIRKAGASGDVEWLSTASALKILFASTTYNTATAGITVTGAYDLYGYMISDNGTLRFGASRSPYHKSVPANYYHTCTNTGRTSVGTPSTAWDAMFISPNAAAVDGAINATNSCVCIGLIGTVTFNGTSGLASASTLATGAMPSWDSTPDTNPQPFLPVVTGLGAQSAENCKVWFTGQGSHLHYDFTITIAAGTATEARISLPATSASNYATLSLSGGIVFTVQTATFHALIEASKAYITIGATALGSQAGLVKRNGDAISAGAQTMALKGSVRIA